MHDTKITEFVYAVVRSDDDPHREPEFIVLPRAKAEELETLERAISVKTWGELRTDFPHLFQAVCEYARYEADDPPSDDSPFDAYDIPAHADGDWPESWQSVQLSTLPPGLPAKCGGDVYATVLNGMFVQFPASAADCVLAALKNLGYQCVEEQELLSSLVSHHLATT
jgi:hypothetical protein